jgi:hypothetical protein
LNICHTNYKYNSLLKTGKKDVPKNLYTQIVKRLHTDIVGKLILEFPL